VGDEVQDEAIRLHPPARAAVEHVLDRATEEVELGTDGAEGDLGRRLGGWRDAAGRGAHSGGGGGVVEKVFFLPIVAVNVDDWQRHVAERKALPHPPPARRTA
jgi:hypothetical protein